MASRPKRKSNVTNRLFYGNTSENVESDYDDDVDDPDFRNPIEKPIGGGENSDSSDAYDSDNGRHDVSEGDNIGDSSRHHVSEGNNDGDLAVAGPSGVGAGESTRGRGRVRGTGRGRGRGSASASEHVKHSRKRMRGEWANEKAKRLRNKGEEYVSYVSGKVVAARKVGDPCKDGCFVKVGDEAINDIFSSFWELGDYDKQNDYISQRVRSVPVKRRYTKNEGSSRVNYEYTVKHFEHEYKVCRNAFISIHAISAKRLITHVQRMKKSATGTPVADKRGKAPNPKKIVGVKLQRVHEHITSLPTTSSHYSRAKSPYRRYLGSGGTIKGLHEKYVSWMNENHTGEEKVTARFYEKVFTEKYNIGFEPPKKDTCSYCDSSKLTIEEKEKNNEDCEDLKNKLKAHRDKYTVVQGLLSSQKNIVQNDNEPTVKVVAMDLQQTLPCPRVTAGVAYYMRKLWVYNFCIYDVQKEKPSMFVWDETIAGRGSDEVSSCLMKWLDKRQGEGEEIDILRVFCDNCGGQNKNINIIVAALRLVHQKKLLRVEFVYLVSGHSYMPCDRYFGNIEKKLRISEGISTTEHYVEAIQHAVTPPFETFAMKKEDFFDVKVLMKHVTRRATTVPFSGACQLVVTFRYKEGYLIKSDYDFNDLNTNVHECRLMKSNKRYSNSLFNLARVDLPLKYPTERLLNPLKVKNLETLLCFLGPASKAWFMNLIERQKQLQTQEATLRQDDEDVGADSENDMVDYDDPMVMPALE